MNPDRFITRQEISREHMAIHDRLPRPLRDINNQHGIEVVQRLYPGQVLSAFASARASEPELFSID